jgi:hypothetical protein
VNDDLYAPIYGRSGGLLVTEWLTSSIGSNGFHQILQSVLPVGYADNHGSGKDTYTVLEEDPITAGVASPFDSPDDNEYAIVAPRTGAVAGSGEDPWNESFNKLITNAAPYICSGNRKAASLETSSLNIIGMSLDITNDGDSGSQEDFFITMRITTDINGKSHNVANLSRVLVQGSDGDNVPLSELRVSAQLPLLDGFAITTRISFYENDSGGPQASAGRSERYVYNAAEDCWDRDSDELCLQSGGSKTASLNLQDFSGSLLDADLYWRFLVD